MGKCTDCLWHIHFSKHTKVSVIFQPTLAGRVSSSVPPESIFFNAQLDALLEMDIHTLDNDENHVFSARCADLSTCISAPIDIAQGAKYNTRRIEVCSLGLD